MYYFNMEIVLMFTYRILVHFKSFELVYDDWNIMHNDKMYYFK